MRLQGTQGHSAESQQGHSAESQQPKTSQGRRADREVQLQGFSKAMVKVGILVPLFLVSVSAASVRPAFMRVLIHIHLYYAVHSVLRCSIYTAVATVYM